MSATTGKVGRLVGLGLGISIFLVFYWSILVDLRVLERSVFQFLAIASLGITLIILLLCAASNRFVRNKQSATGRVLRLFLTFILFLALFHIVTAAISGELPSFTGDMPEIALVMYLPAFFSIVLAHEAPYISIPQSFKRGELEASLGDKTAVELLGDEKFQDFIQHSDASIGAVISHLHGRAKEMTNRATVVLILIVCILLVAGAFIVFAGKIAEIGAARIDPFGNIGSQREQIEANIQAVLDRIHEQLEQEEKKVQNRDDGAEDGEKSNAQGQGVIPPEAENLEQSSQVALWTSELNHLRERQRRLDEDYSAMQNTWTSAVLARGGGLLESISDPKLLLAEGLTRLGVLVVSIYLVQILISLYRYNSRIASYYLACADALVLAGKDQVEISGLMRFLYPGLDFGRTPRTLWETVSEAWSRGSDKKEDKSNGDSKDTESKSA